MSSLIVTLLSFSFFLAPSLQAQDNISEEKDPGRRVWRYNQLSEPSAETWQLLLQGIQDPVPEVQETAVSQMGTLLRKTSGFPSELKDALPLLAAALKAPEGRTSMWAAEILGKMGKAGLPARAVLLERITEEKAQKTLLWIMFSLTQCKDLEEKDVSLLAGFLTHPSFDVSRYAANLLSQLEGKAKPALKELVAAYHKNPSDRSLRGFSAEALANIGPDASEALPVLLKGVVEDKSYAVRAWSAVALRKIAPQDPTVIETLARVRETDPSLSVRRATQENYDLQDLQGVLQGLP